MAAFEFTARPYGMGPKGAWQFVILPKEFTGSLRTRGRVPIVFTVGGKAFRVSAFPDGEGGHQINFNKAMQAAAARSGGNVRATVAVDAAKRSVTPPKDLKAALAKDARAKAFFEGLAPSHKKAYADWIEEAKRPETRAKRIAETVERLKKARKFE